MQRDYASVSIHAACARGDQAEEGLLRKCGARAKPILHIQRAADVAEHEHYLEIEQQLD